MIVGEAIVKFTAISAGGVTLLTGCTGSAPEAAPSFTPSTSDAAEAPASPSPEVSRIVISPSPAESPTPSVSPEKADEIGSVIMGTITNTEDASGEPIGVWVFASPHVDERNGTLAQGDRVAIECIEEDAREGEDHNVAGGPITWDDYYKLWGTRDLQDQYVPKPFLVPDEGEQAVPSC